MFQSVIVMLLFIGAVIYTGWLVYKNFQAKNSGCASGCGKCGVDFSKIQQQMQKKGL